MPSHRLTHKAFDEESGKVTDLTEPDMTACAPQFEKRVDYDAIRNTSLRAAALPLRDVRDEADILGMDNTGLPT